MHVRQPGWLISLFPWHATIRAGSSYQTHSHCFSVPARHTRKTRLSLKSYRHSRINLSPFTKDFRGCGTCIETILFLEACLPAAYYIDTEQKTNKQLFQNRALNSGRKKIGHTTFTVAAKKTMERRVIWSTHSPTRNIIIPPSQTQRSVVCHLILFYIILPWFSFTALVSLASQPLMRSIGKKLFELANAAQYPRMTKPNCEVNRFYNYHPHI